MVGWWGEHATQQSKPRSNFFLLANLFPFLWDRQWKSADRDKPNERSHFGPQNILTTITHTLPCPLAQSRAKVQDFPRKVERSVRPLPNAKGAAEWMPIAFPIFAAVASRNSQNHVQQVQSLGALQSVSKAWSAASNDSNLHCISPVPKVDACVYPPTCWSSPRRSKIGLESEVHFLLFF